MPIEHPSFVPTITTEQIKFLKETFRARSYYGAPTNECRYCCALFLFQEKVGKDTDLSHGRSAYNLCCRAARLRVAPDKDFSPPLAQLMRFDGGHKSTLFMASIRQYNSIFAFTSMGVHIDKSINMGQDHVFFG